MLKTVSVKERIPTILMISRDHNVSSNPKKNRAIMPLFSSYDYFTGENRTKGFSP
jgi:hypothetical protein